MLTINYSDIRLKMIQNKIKIISEIHNNISKHNRKMTKKKKNICQNTFMRFTSDEIR